MQYTITPVDATHYKGSIKITNNLNVTVNNFNLTWELAQGQRIQQPVTVATFVQSGNHNGLNLQTKASGIFGLPFSIGAHSSITPTYTASLRRDPEYHPAQLQAQRQTLASNHH